MKSHNNIVIEKMNSVPKEVSSQEEEEEKEVEGAGGGDGSGAGGAEGRRSWMRCWSQSWSCWTCWTNFWQVTPNAAHVAKCSASRNCYIFTEEINMWIWVTAISVTNTLTA